jgi:hypothetical protein
MAIRTCQESGGAAQIPEDEGLCFRRVDEALRGRLAKGSHGIDQLFPALRECGTSPNPAQIRLCLFAAVLNRMQQPRLPIEQLGQLVRIAWIILIVTLGDVRRFAHLGDECS